MKGWPVLLFLLAGCLDAPTDSLGAHEAHRAAEADLDGFEYVLFLGIAATEGPVDEAAYAASLDGTWQDLRAAFGPLPQDDVVGDGRAAAWIATHYVWDKQSDRAGGLYTQVTPDGVQRAFLPFVGVYGGQPGTLRLGLRAMDEGPTICTLETGTQDWRLDAEDAARRAAQEPVFQEHVAAHPGGEYTYAYMPRLTVDPACAKAELGGNDWTVLHTDLDGFLNGTDALAAEVRVDAAAGAVLEAGLTPIRAPVTRLIEGRIDVEDPLVPELVEQAHRFAFDVEAGAAIELHAIRREVPDGVRDATTRLIDPDGAVRSEITFGTPVHQHLVEDAVAGTWHLEYAYTSSLPQGRHVVDVFVRM